ncbi:MAG: ParA family protein [Pseudomonadota bacterium]|nr:ParA family protein [Pseudomonadota bacterium]
MKSISMLAQKGGTGKTTLSIHLAVQATLAGLKVLIIDIDPQASVTAWWRRRNEETPAVIQSRGDVLAGVLSNAQSHRYDLAVIDTAPHSSEDSKASACLSDSVYIPTRPSLLDLEAIGASTSLVSDLGMDARIVLNCCPPPNRYGEPHIVSEARQALQVYGIPVAEAAISQRAAFSHALLDGRAVSEFDPNGKAAAEMTQLWQTLSTDLNL